MEDCRSTFEESFEMGHRPQRAQLSKAKVYRGSKRAKPLSTSLQAWKARVEADKRIAEPGEAPKVGSRRRSRSVPAFRFEKPARRKLLSSREMARREGSLGPSGKSLSAEEAREGAICGRVKRWLTVESGRAVAFLSVPKLTWAPRAVCRPSGWVWKQPFQF